MFIIQFIWLKNVEYMNYLVPIICTMAIISSILNYIINPGIIFSSNRFVDKIYCSSCKMLYPKTSRNIVHCYTCDICVQGFDHHCGVIGKCVGKYNMIIFSSLSISGMAFMICLMLVIFNIIFYYK